MGKLTFLLMVIILIIVVPLVLRQGYRVAKKSGQVTEYWGWFGGFMVFYVPILVFTIWAGLTIPK